MIQFFKFASSLNDMTAIVNLRHCVRILLATLFSFNFFHDFCGLPRDSQTRIKFLALDSSMYTVPPAFSVFFFTFRRKGQPLLLIFPNSTQVLDAHC